MLAPPRVLLMHVVCLLSGDEITAAGGNFTRILAKISLFQPVGVGTYHFCL